jgi:hypothetical protein
MVNSLKRSIMEKDLMEAQTGTRILGPIGGVDPLIFIY